MLEQERQTGTLADFALNFATDYRNKSNRAEFKRLVLETFEECKYVLL